MLSFREVLVGDFRELLGDLILEVLSTEIVIISDQNILIYIPFHVILKQNLKHIAIVVKVLLDIVDVLGFEFGGAKEHNRPAFVVLADVLKDLERVKVVEGFERVFRSHLLLPIEIFLDCLQGFSLIVLFNDQIAADQVV